MKRIKQLNIMGRNIKINYVKNMCSQGNLWGKFSIDKMAIDLDADMDDEYYRTTLIHEVTHAVLALSGVSYLLSNEEDEAVVRCIEYNLIPALEELTKKTQIKRRKK